MTRSRFWLVCPLLLASCRFIALDRDLSRFEDLAVIQGQVSPTVDLAHPLVVVLQSASAQAIDFTVLPRPGTWFFAVPAGRYRLAAFEDRNGDLAHQPESEPAMVYDAGGELALAVGDRREGLDLVVDSQRLGPIPLAIGNLAARTGGVAELPSFHVGTVVSLDDPRFAPHNAQVGLWQPAHFVFEIGSGVFFLEEYDPDRIPVLFVHGALGTPRDFAYLIERLDRRRFQPWVIYYPTAGDLEGTARHIVRIMFQLHARHPYEKIAVVAHSMGGLVARAAINHLAADYAPLVPLVTLPVFVTISTPWNGQVMARLGAQHAPVPAPSWLSMTPGSPFLTKLRETPLPEHTRHHLFFSYQGRSALIGEANDDVVALSSELPLEIQRDAIRVLGFDESHESILKSGKVADALDEALAEIEP